MILTVISMTAAGIVAAVEGAAAGVVAEGAFASDSSFKRLRTKQPKLLFDRGLKMLCCIS